MKNNICTLIVKYDPFENNVQFEIKNATGGSKEIADNEPLKDYENSNGIFTLEGQGKPILNYIYANFDGESEVALIIEVSKTGYIKKQNEFQRFEDAVNCANKNNRIKIQLSVDQFGIEDNDLYLNGHQNEGNLPPQKVAVLGKIHSGKSELIKGVLSILDTSFDTEVSQNGYLKYIDKKNYTEWYEIDGIELGRERITKARKTLDELTKNGITIVFYCLYSMTGKIEDLERDLIVEFQRNNPNIKFCAVVTACLNDATAQAFADTIRATTKQTKVLLVLAKEMRTKAGYIEPFGISEILKEIYGELDEHC